MKTQRLFAALTVVNAAVLAFQLFHPRPAGAEGTPAVLRAHALEIVDKQDRVRATLSVIAADPTFKMPDGSKGSPETVLLRMINERGRPTVKLESTGTGSAMGLFGENDPTNVLITARRTEAAVSATRQDGHNQTFKP